MDGLECSWVVEVDGPSHFLQDSTKMTGSTLLKYRQLQMLGYRLVKVPYFEWNWARGDWATYLGAKLEAATRTHVQSAHSRR